jgi:hypothetical protein
MENRSAQSHSSSSFSDDGSQKSGRSEEWDSEGDESDVEDDNHVVHIRNTYSEHSEESYSEKSDVMSESMEEGSAHDSYATDYSDTHHSGEEDESLDASSEELAGSGSEGTGTVSDGSEASGDETDTCLLSIDEHVRRRQSWHKMRYGQEEAEPIDLACLDSDVGTLGESTLGTLEQKRRRTPIVAERDLNNVEYMTVFEIASTNRDISVVQPLTKRAAYDAFHKKEVPEEIPVNMRDDVSSILYPPVRPPIRYPRKKPMNGMILEDVVSDAGYDDEELGNSIKSFEKSFHEKKSGADQRSDLELILIAVISFSLLILVILLIVILAKNS